MSLSLFLLFTACSNTNLQPVALGDAVVADDKGGSRPPRQPRRLNVSFDEADGPSEDIVLPGTDVYVDTFRLRAVGEPMVLTDFSLPNMGDEETVEAVYAYYEDVDGTVVQSYASVVGGVATFSGENMLVPTDSSVWLDIFVSTDDGTDATPGQTMRFDWTDDGVSATGRITGRTFGAGITTDSVEGVEFEWHVSQPTVSLSSSSPSGDGDPELAEWLRFNIAAASEGDIGITSLTFEVSSTDNASSGWNRNISGCGFSEDTLGLTETDFSLYNLTTDGTSTSVETSDDDWVLLATSWTRCDDGDPVEYVVLDLDVPIEIPRGTTNTFALYMDATGASEEEDDALRFTIVGLTWEDAGYEFDEYLVDNLPVTGGTSVF